MGRDLTQRVEQNAQVQRQQPQSLAALIEQMKPQIARALPKHMDPDRIARIALTVVRQTPQLARCNPQSFLGALMTAAQLGLEPGPLGEAYFVPFKNEVTFIPGYRGLVKLAWQSGQMKSISAHVVHANDEFDYAYGLEPVLRHKPALTNAGDVIAVYAAAVLKDGGSAFIVLSRDDVEDIRKRSRAGQDGPWVTDWDAMARKTAVRQLIRWLPLSSELRALQTAALLDESVRRGDDVAKPLDEVAGDFIELESHEVHPQAQEAEPQEPAAEKPAAKAPRRAAKASDGGEETITQAQQRALHAILRKAVGNDRAAGLVLIAQELGLDELASTEDLTKAQASVAIEKVQALVDAKAKPQDQAPSQAEVDAAWGVAPEGGE